MKSKKKPKPERLADALRSARIGLSLSKERLAEYFGVSWHTLHSWETGRRPIEGPARLLCLALVFSGARLDLMSGDESRRMGFWLKHFRASGLDRAAVE